MVRILGSTATRRRRRYQLGAIVSLVTVLAVLVVPNAFAVHDLQMQLDGDVDHTTTTNVGGIQPLDWDSLFDSSGTPTALPADFTASGFHRDFLVNTDGSFNTSDTTTFATGSKDTLPITPGWQCNFDHNVNSKIDIMNAYAAAYTNPANGHEILYFGLERNANTGDGNVAFWFLQDDVDCDSTAGTAPFTGDHTDGDLLAVSAFTNGGGVSTIDVYRWNGGAGGSLGTTAVAHGVDCKSTAGADTVCATTNSGTLPINGSINTPWPTSNKQDGPGNTLRTSEFFEGGIDLTASNLGGLCFNVFIGDTRSSQSLTATLFDFARGSIGECRSTTETTPLKANGDPIPPGGLSISTYPVEVKDQATVTTFGISSFSGDVKFFICGPIATGTCDGTTNVGDQIGSAQPVTSSPTTVTSDVAQFTKAGRYCWRAEFSGDPSVQLPGSSDSSESECFVINPVQPTLTTTAGTSPVTLGSPITDTAQLNGTANQPGTGGLGDGSINPTTLGGPADGTITFTLVGPNNCTSVPAGFVPIEVTVSGDSDTAYTASFSPTAVGTYTWIAEYSGDGPNTLGAGPTGCPDANEAVTVTDTSAITTAQEWLPNDSATITSAGGSALDGSVTFTLYDNGTCDGNVLYTEGPITVSGSSPQTESTHNTSVTVSATATVSWRAVYTSNNSNVSDSQSNCETTALTITN